MFKLSVVGADGGVYWLQAGTVTPGRTLGSATFTWATEDHATALPKQHLLKWVKFINTHVRAASVTIHRIGSDWPR